MLQPAPSDLRGFPWVSHHRDTAGAKHLAPMGSDGGDSGLKTPAHRKSPFFALSAQQDGVWDTQQSSRGRDAPGAPQTATPISAWKQRPDPGAALPRGHGRAFWVLSLPSPLVPPPRIPLPLWQGQAHCLVTCTWYFHRDSPPFSNDIPILSLLPGPAHSWETR